MVALRGGTALHSRHANRVCCCCLLCFYFARGVLGSFGATVPTAFAAALLTVVRFLGANEGAPAAPAPTNSGRDFGAAVGGCSSSPSLRLFGALVAAAAADFMMLICLACLSSRA